MGMTTDFKNGYAVGLQADLGAYVEEEKTYYKAGIEVVDAPKIEMIYDAESFEVVDAPKIEMIYDAESFEVVDAPKIEMICICTEAEYDE